MGYVMEQYSLSERARLQADGASTIDAPVSILQSGAGCRLADAAERNGRAAHVVRLSAAEGDAGAGGDSSESQVRVPAVRSGKAWLCAFGSEAGSAGVIWSTTGWRPDQPSLVHGFVSDCQ